MKPKKAQQAPKSPELLPKGLVLAASAGTPEEMVCLGGELAFVTQIVQDSINLQGRVHWYTSMLGKKATLKQIRLLLHNSKVTALRTTEFVQVRNHVYE